MSAKLTWLDTAGQPQCGHRLEDGYPGEAGEWWCTYCALHVTAQLDQDIAAAEAAAQERERP